METNLSNQKLLRWTLALLLAAFFLPSQARKWQDTPGANVYYECDVVIDGKAYELYDDYAIMVPFSYHRELVGPVMQQARELHYNYGSLKYSGDIEVPEQIEYQEHVYRVKSVHTHAFDNCDDVTDVIIPKTVRYDFAYWINVPVYFDGSLLVSVNDDMLGISGYSINPFPWLMRQPAGKVIYQDDLVAMICPYSIFEKENTPYSQWKTPLLDEIVLKEGSTKILDYAAKDLNVKNLVLPETLTEIGSAAFMDALIDTINLDKVKAIGDSAFCKAELGTISWPLEDIGQSVFRESTLKHISFNPNLKTIGDYAFCDCKQLADVQLPDSLTDIGNSTFSGCTSLTDIVFPNSLIEISNNAFSGCTSLVNVTFPNSLSTIGDAAFYECASLKDVVFPNSLTNIGSSAFYKCTSLTDIIIPYSVSMLGNESFSNCAGLTNITIPCTIKGIGRIIIDYYSCKSLTLTGNGGWTDLAPVAVAGIYAKTLNIGNGITALGGKLYSSAEVVNCYAETPPECNNNTFLNYNGELHVPSGAMAAYFISPIWENFTNLNADLTDKVTLEETEAQMLKGEELQLSAYTVPEAAALAWGTTDPAVAVVDASGKVTATGVGECDIYASLADNLAVYAACHIDVHNRTVISLPTEELTACLNTIVTLTPMFDPEPTEIVAISSDPSVAIARIINAPSNGAAHAPVAGTKIFQVLGVKEGVSIITVASADGISVPATLKVTVINHFPEGDVNCDRAVNGADITALYNALLGENPGPAGMPAIYTTHLDGTPVLDGDVNGDGVVNGTDVTTLYNLLLGQ